MHRKLRQMINVLVAGLLIGSMPLPALAATYHVSTQIGNTSSKQKATVPRTIVVYYQGKMSDAELTAWLQQVYPNAQFKIIRTTLKPTPTPTPTPVPVPTPTPTPVPAPTPQPVSGLTQDEQMMFDLINQERAKAGVAPLVIDNQLEQIARLKSQDMVVYNYFSHTSPTYGSPFDMMAKFGVKYSYAGENIAGASTVQTAHTNLMNSPGHKANILDSHYTRVGIGIINGSKYGKIFTQEFAG